MYRVLKDFTDIETKHVYHTGDTFPCDGFTASDERVAELATSNNKRGEVLIEEEPKESKPKEVKRKKKVKKDADRTVSRDS